MINFINSTSDTYLLSHSSTVCVHTDWTKMDPLVALSCCSVVLAHSQWLIHTYTQDSILLAHNKWFTQPWVLLHNHS